MFSLGVANHGELARPCAREQRGCARDPTRRLRPTVRGRRHGALSRVGVGRETDHVRKYWRPPRPSFASASSIARGDERHPRRTIAGRCRVGVGVKPPPVGRDLAAIPSTSRRAIWCVRAGRLVRWCRRSPALPCHRRQREATEHETCLMPRTNAAALGGIRRRAVMNVTSTTRAVAPRGGRHAEVEPSTVRRMARSLASGCVVLLPPSDSGTRANQVRRKSGRVRRHFAIARMIGRAAGSSLWDEHVRQTPSARHRGPDRVGQLLRSKRPSQDCWIASG